MQRERADDARLELFERHRSLLFGVAYRMLGMHADAEDMVQETFVRWERASETEIRNPRAFMVTVITRLCINQLQSARARREQYVGHWLPEPVASDTETEPDVSNVDESLSTAFLLMLERLTPIQRAVFLLREVFEYDYAEIARILGQTEANCRQILKRARQSVTEDRPRFEVSPRQQQRLLERFLEATSHGDLEGLVALLSNDVVLYTDGGGKARAVPNPVYGPTRVARFLLGAREKLLPEGVVRRIAAINGLRGIVASHGGRPIGVLTIDVADGRVRNIYIVANPDKLERLPTS